MRVSGTFGAMRTAPTSAPLLYAQSHKVVAIDRDSGRARWSHSLKAQVIRVLFSGERVFVLDLDGNLECLVAETGAVLGHVPSASPNAWGATMLAHDGGIYVATNEGVIALDFNGNVLWRHAAESSNMGLALPGLALPGSVAQPDLKG